MLISAMIGQFFFGWSPAPNDHAGRSIEVLRRQIADHTGEDLRRAVQDYARACAALRMLYPCGEDRDPTGPLDLLDIANEPEEFEVVRAAVDARDAAWAAVCRGIHGLQVRALRVSKE